MPDQTVTADLKFPAIRVCREEFDNHDGSLTLNEYQARAMATARFPPAAAVIDPLLGLVGELGELCEKVLSACGPVPRAGSVLGRTFAAVAAEAARVGRLAEAEKKRVRDGVPLSAADAAWVAAAGERVRAAGGPLLKELGDVQWYLAAAATGFAAALGDVAQANLDKLAGRCALGGSGDDR